MSSAWRTIRVFISSTFRDMHAERDYLVRVVFPELRQRLEEYRVHLVDIDLRWGLTAEQVENDLGVELCLRQVDECRPFFLALLGGRYGWTPQRLPEETRRRFPWVDHFPGVSITELEILHATLRNPRAAEGTLFCLRDDDATLNIPEPLRTQVYVESDPVSRSKLTELKDRIRASGLPVVNYSARWDAHALDPSGGAPGRLVGLEALGVALRDHLWESLRKRLRLDEDVPPTRDPLEVEADFHERFLESRLQVFVGREDIEQTLTEYVESDADVVCVLGGPSGSGKSSILARFVSVWRSRHPDDVVLPHFVGVSPRSTSLRDVLGRLCRELQRRLSLDGELPDDVEGLTASFRESLAQVPTGSRLVLILDALDQLDPVDRAHELEWLPETLPAGVRIVVSCVQETGPTLLPVLTRRRHVACRVQPLSADERREVIRQVPSLAAKTLDPQQVQLLLENPATASPLFLRVALEELRGFGSFERLNARIAALPRDGDDLEALFHQVFERLEQEFTPVLVRDALTLLACARRGLSEREMAGLLNAADVFPLLRQLRPYLLSRGNLLDFYHRVVTRAVQGRYLKTPESVRTVHHRLADYFGTLPLWLREGERPRPNVRVVDERPWHALRALQRDVLQELLTNLEFVEAKNLAGLLPDLMDDYRAALETWHGDSVHNPLRRTPGPTPSLGLRENVASVLRGEAPAHANLGAAPVLLQLRELPETSRTWNGRWEELPSIRQRPTEPRDSGSVERLLQRLRAPTKEVHEASDETAQVQDYWTFLIAQRHHLDRLPEETITLARNHANDGVVVDAAERLLHARSLWMARSPRPPRPPRYPTCPLRLQQPGWVFGLALTPDGRTAVAGDWSKNAIAWDLTTGLPRRTLQGYPDGLGGNLGVRTDGEVVVVGGQDDGTLIVWDLASGTTRRTAVGHSGRSFDATVSADGVLALSSGRDGLLCVWNLETGAVVRRLEVRPQQPTFLAMTPDGLLAVTTIPNDAIIVWDLARGQLLRSWSGCNAATVDLSPDGRFLLAGIDDNLVLWDLIAGQGWKVGQTQLLSVSSVRMTPDARLAVVGGANHHLEVWDVFRGERVRSFEGHTSSIASVGLTADGTLAVSTGSSDSTIRAWDIAQGVEARSLPGQVLGPFNWVGVSADGSVAVSGDQGEHNCQRILCVWDWQHGDRPQMLDEPIVSALSPTLTPDGRGVLTTTPEGAVTLQELRTGRPLLQLATDGLVPLKGLTATAHGTALGVDENGRVRVWDLTTGRLVRRWTAFGNLGKLYRVRFDREGKRIVLMSEGGIVWSWSVEEPRIAQRLPSPEDELVGHTVASDGAVAVGRLKNYRLVVWDLDRGEVRQEMPFWDRTRGVERRTHYGGNRGYHTVGLTADGGKAILGCMDNIIRIWDLRTGECLASYAVESRLMHLSEMASKDRFAAITYLGQVHLLSIRVGQ